MFNPLLLNMMSAVDFSYMTFSCQGHSLLSLLFFSLSAIPFHVQFVFNTDQFHHMKSYYESKHKYINIICNPKYMDSIQVWGKKEMSIHSHSSLRSAGGGGSYVSF